ncbi:MAG: DUF935 family protein, partial [Candidatus Binataceae bacterium]
LNLGPMRQYPKLVLGLPDDQDAKEFADIVGAMADRGLRVAQKAVLDKLGLPEAAPGDAILSPARAGARSSNWGKRRKPGSSAFCPGRLVTSRPGTKIFTGWP